MVQVPALPRGSLVEVVPVVAAAAGGGAGEVAAGRLRASHTAAATADGNIACDALLTVPEADGADSSDSSEEEGSEGEGAARSVSTAAAPELGTANARGGGKTAGSAELRCAHAALSCAAGSSAQGDRATLQRQLRDLLACCSDALGITGRGWRSVSSITVTHREGLGDVWGASAAALGDLSGAAADKLALSCVPVTEIVAMLAGSQEVLLQAQVLALS